MYCVFHDRYYRANAHNNSLQELSEKPKATNTTETVLKEEVVDVVPVTVKDGKKGKNKSKGKDAEKEAVVIKSEDPKKENEEVKKETDLKPVIVKDLIKNPPFDVNKVFPTKGPETVQKKPTAKEVRAW